MYTYYIIERPISIGTQPSGFDHFDDYDKRTYIPEIGRKAWGKLYYTRELTEKEIKDYELVKGNKTK